MLDSAPTSAVSDPEAGDVAPLAFSIAPGPSAVAPAPPRYAFASKSVPPTPRGSLAGRTRAASAASMLTTLMPAWANDPNRLKFARRLLRQQLIEQVAGAALALAFLPTLLLLAALWSSISDEQAADPAVDVRYPADDVSYSAPRVAVACATAAALALAAVLQAWLLLRNLGRSVARSFGVRAAASVALCTAPVAWRYTSAAGRDRFPWVIALVMCVVIALMGRHVAREVKSRLAGLLLSAAFVGTGGVVMMLTLVETRMALAIDTTDDLRIFYLGVLHPLLYEVVSMPLRMVARLWPGRDPVNALALLAGASGLARVSERFVVTTFQTTGGLVAVLLLIGLRDVALRWTVNQRDEWTVRRFGWRRDASFTLPVGAAVRNLDEVTDTFATYTALALNLAYRMSAERRAADAGPQVLLCGVQLLLEAAADIVPYWLVLRRCGPRLVERAYRLIDSRERQFRRMTRWQWACVFYCVWALANFFVEILGAPGPGSRALLCAWSKSSGAVWWVRVPCAVSLSWLSD